MSRAINIWGDETNVTMVHYPSSHLTDGRRPTVIICPGGSYREHAEHEGKGYAEWLNGYGVECFVLEYRLGSQGHRYPAPLDDLARAIKVVRHHAHLWGIDPMRVGVMGSSAGGHLASILLTHFDKVSTAQNELINKQSCRPDFGILCYPVISMENDPHSVSRLNLLENAASASELKFLSSDTQVTDKVPPCFIWHTAADASVKSSHSLRFALALSNAGVPFELHVYQTGRHGMGLNTRHPWAKSCVHWLNLHGLIDQDPLLPVYA